MGSKQTGPLQALLGGARPRKHQEILEGRGGKATRAHPSLMGCEEATVHPLCSRGSHQWLAVASGSDLGCQVVAHSSVVGNAIGVTANHTCLRCFAQWQLGAAMLNNPPWHERYMMAACPCAQAGTSWKGVQQLQGSCRAKNGSSCQNALMVQWHHSNGDHSKGGHSKGSHPQGRPLQFTCACSSYYQLAAV